MWTFLNMISDVTEMARVDWPDKLTLFGPCVQRVIFRNSFLSESLSDDTFSLALEVPQSSVFGKFLGQVPLKVLEKYIV